MRAGSHLAHVTGVKESGDAVDNVMLPVTSSMTSLVMVWGGISLEDCIGLHVLANSTLIAVRNRMKSSEQLSDLMLGPGFLLVPSLM